MFDKPMVLFHHVLIDRDGPRGGRMCGPEGFLKEALGGVGIPRLTEQKVDGLTGGIHGPGEVIPLFLDFNVCLSDAVRVMRLGKMRVAPLVPRSSGGQGPPARRSPPLEP